MSFSSQKAVHYFVNQFHCLLIKYIKMAAMLKRQQFEDSKSEETEPRVSKCQHVGIHDDEEEQSLDKYEGEKEDVRYVPLPFIAPPPPQKESNRPTDMGERTRSLNHLIYIPLNYLVYIPKLII